ncbi:ABC transporter G family member 37 [Linum perenne]
MIGFEWEAKKFLWYIFFIYFTLLYFTFYGIMTVAVTPNYHIAAIISSFFYSLWNRFCGFMIPRQVSIYPLFLQTLRNNKTNCFGLVIGGLQSIPIWLR